MRVSKEEKNNYSKKNASFGVYYDNVKEMFNPSSWRKLKNKQDAIYAFYLNGITVIEAFNLIYKILKKK
jgi:hypothetical protein